MFKRNYLQYLKDYVPYLLTAVFSIFITYIIISKIIIDNTFLQIIINLLLVCIIPNLIHLIVFYKSEEMKYYVEILRKIRTKNKK